MRQRLWVRLDQLEHLLPLRGKRSKPSVTGIRILEDELPADGPQDWNEDMIDESPDDGVIWRRIEETAPQQRRLGPLFRDLV
jgi:hypothetical protein